MLKRKLVIALASTIGGCLLIGVGCASGRSPAHEPSANQSIVKTESPQEENQPPRIQRAVLASATIAREVKLITSGEFGLPNPGVVLDPESTAIVITDPQNDFLSPEGVTWGVVGQSVTANNTVENIEKLFATAQSLGVPVFVSPHYYYPHDHDWKFEGALERLMHNIEMFDREHALSLKGFEDSGADWLARYKPYIDGENVVVTSPHKVYGPETNDLVLQLRKRGMDKVILAGMSANLCTESHLRELQEQGFEVVVVEDATAGAKTPAGDAYQAALTNFRYMASAVVTTEEVVEALRDLHRNQEIAGN